MSSWILANMDALPGVGAELVAQERLVLMQPAQPTDLFPIGGAIDGSNSRDPDNPTGRVDILRDGMPMGRITATNKWAPSIIGQLGKALGASDTNVVLSSAAEAAEITRRIVVPGGTTFKITGPPSTAGTVATITATLSSVGAGSGQNAVNTVAWTSAPSAGTFTITALKSDGTYVTTAAINYNSTTVATSMNAVLGTSAVSVSYTSTYAYSGFTVTYSGSGYAAVAQPIFAIDVSQLTQATAGYTCTQTTLGVPVAGTVTLTGTAGTAFVAGSLIQPTDGSESIRTLLVTGQRTGVSVYNALLQSIDVHFPIILHSGVIRTAYIIGYAGNDASTKAYIKTALRTYGGRWIFDDDFLGTSV